MNASIKLFGVLAIVVGAACGPMGPEELASLSAEPQAASEGPSLVEPVSDERELTPEELQALVEKAEKNPPVFPAIACVGANTCDPSFSACTTWSQVKTCGSLSTCNLDGLDTCGAAGSQTQPQYQYQVCFNAYGAQCTSVARTTATVCGCGL
jgi:hypothetical protein